MIAYAQQVIYQYKLDIKHNNIYIKQKWLDIAVWANTPIYFHT